MKKKQYCILRTRTINSNLKITQCAKHNFRLRTQRNIDTTQTANNKILVNELNVDPSKSEDLQEKLHGFYEELGVKQKKGNVLSNQAKLI